MNKSNKTLLQILVEELPNRGGWPKGVSEMSQGAITGYIYADGHRILFRHNVYGGADRVTRDQYEAALAEKEHSLPWDEKNTDADGWIYWHGGECPVSNHVVVDVKFRDQIEPVLDGDPAENFRWEHFGNSADIIAYRLHQPQKLEEHTHVGGGLAMATTAAYKPEIIPFDECDGSRVESDLNECIGQAPEDYEAIRADILGIIHDAGSNISIGDAFEITEMLIDAGYRKQ